MEDIIFGEHGLTASMHKNRCLVDMSTIDPVLTRAMAARAFELNRLCWIDAPVSGGTVGAEAGTLAIMAGGRAEDIDVVRPILSHLGQRVTHMGPNGAGQVTKLVNQIIVSVTMGMIAEAAGLAVRSGIDAAKIPEALKGGRADSTIMQQMWARFIAEDYKPTGTVDSILKDVTLLRSFAAAFAAPLPFTNMAGEYYRWLAANGHGDEDLTSMFRFFAKAGKDE
jgi:2-hydroxy-3-oxopropionate reductase